MTPRHHESSTLRAKLKQLAGARRSQDPHQIEAYAEACFRLAVHPDTPPAEVLPLLRQAHHVDEANPKYLYHIARVLFAHGEFDRAADWLRRAVTLCPTSHRIWTHISLLQRELNGRFRGNASFEPDALRKRGEKVAAVIRDGKDPDLALLDFTPPRSLASIEQEQRSQEAAAEEGFRPHKAPPDAADVAPPKNKSSAKPTPRRLVADGSCRWSGILDLEIEHQLEANPSERNLKRILPLIEQAADLASERDGGTAAFVILAIQWLLAGYPLATIDRLAGKLPSGSDTLPSRKLLTIVCDLFSVDESQLPAAIAHALADGQISPSVAALIHQRRLLWQPLEFRGISAYRAARHHLDEHDTAADAWRVAAASHAQALQNALSAYCSPRPAALEEPAVVAATAQPLTAESAEARLKAIEEAGLALEKLRTEAFALLKTNFASPPQTQEAYSQATADLGAFQTFLAALKESAQAQLANLDALTADVAQLATAGAITKFPERKDATNTHLCSSINTGNFLKNFARIDKQLAAAGDRFSKEPKPASTAVAGLTTAARALAPQGAATEKPADPAQSDRAPGETSPTQPSLAHPVAPQAAAPPANQKPDPAAAPLTPADALKAAMQQVNAAVSRRFAQADATFNLYPPAVRNAPAFKSLRLSLLARKAETFYRLGHRRPARAAWAALLSEDALNHGAARNIALCDMPDPELSRSLSSWRHYADVLYSRAIARGDLSAHANDRAELHRALGGAYAPSGLLGELDKDWSDRLEVTELLNFMMNVSRVRNFVSHLLLEHLNERLSVSHPALVLGLSRAEASPRFTSASKSQQPSPLCQAACQELTQFCGRLKNLLPPRSSPGFAKALERHWDRAAKKCGEPKGLALKDGGDFPDQVTRYTTALSSFCSKKFRLLLAFQEKDVCTRLARKASSVDAFAQLDRLDQVPLQISPDLLQTVLMPMQIEPDLMQKVAHVLKENFVVAVLRFVLSEPTDAEEESLRQRQYRRLVDDWAHTPALAVLLSAIDDPQIAYPPAIKTSLEDIVAACRDANPPPAQAVSQAIELAKRWQSRFPELAGPVYALRHLLTQAEDPSVVDGLFQLVIDKGVCAATRDEVRLARALLWWKQAVTFLNAKDIPAARPFLDKARSDAQAVASTSNQETAKEAKGLLDQIAEVSQAIRGHG